MLGALGSRFEGSRLWLEGLDQGDLLLHEEVSSLALEDWVLLFLADEHDITCVLAGPYRQK